MSIYTGFLTSVASLIVLRFFACGIMHTVFTGASSMYTGQPDDDGPCWDQPTRSIFLQKQIFPNVM